MRGRDIHWQSNVSLASMVVTAQAQKGEGTHSMRKPASGVARTHGCMNPCTPVHLVALLCRPYYKTCTGNNSGLAHLNSPLTYEDDKSCDGVFVSSPEELMKRQGRARVYQCLHPDACLGNNRCRKGHRGSKQTNKNARTFMGRLLQVLHVERVKKDSD